MEQPDFVRFLFQGAQVGSIGMKNVSLERRSLGMLDLPDGRLFACDPLVPVDCAALEHRLAPGPYEVVLFVLSGIGHGTAEGPVECNAAAALLCSDAAPVEWQLAPRGGGALDAAAYGVDSGTGSFLSHDALSRLTEDQGVDGQLIIDALAASPGSVVVLSNQASAAVFCTGIGDGIYDTWLGLDLEGRPAIILTDFQVLDSPEEVDSVHAQWKQKQMKKWWQFWK